SSPRTPTPRYRRPGWPGRTCHRPGRAWPPPSPRRGSCRRCRSKACASGSVPQLRTQELRTAFFDEDALRFAELPLRLAEGCLALGRGADRIEDRGLLERGEAIESVVHRALEGRERGIPLLQQSEAPGGVVRPFRVERRRSQDARGGELGVAVLLHDRLDEA